MTGLLIVDEEHLRLKKMRLTMEMRKSNVNSHARRTNEIKRYSAWKAI